MNSPSSDVHKMEYETRKTLLKQNFHDLGKLLKATVAHPSQFIEHDQLVAFNISLTDFSLDSDIASNAIPQFFKPFPHDLMEESFTHSSQFEDDLGWPPYEPEYLYPFLRHMLLREFWVDTIDMRLHNGRKVHWCGACGEEDGK
jgi:hypothetical protein